MKKLLLSSLMMFAVCGYVSAQNATGSKFQKAGTTSTAPTPQKAAVLNTEATSDAMPATDKDATQAVAPAPNDKAAKFKAAQAKPSPAVTADGVVVTADDLSPKEKAELKKMEAAKAAAAKKNN